MARSHVSSDRRRAAAIQAVRREIAAGEHPTYRVRIAQDDAWTVEAAPWLTGTATGRSDALAAARAAIATMLEVVPEAIELDAGP
jgi:hypothetical protein